MLFSAVKPMLLNIDQDVDLLNENSLYEPKYDGFRLLLHKDGNRIEIYTRNGNRITEKLPEIVESVKEIKADKAILDGEGVVFRNGRPVFDDFAYRGRITDPLKIKAARNSHPATYVIFDIISDGNDLSSQPLIERKKRLQELISSNNHIITTPFVQGDGEKLFNWTKENDWEGIVCKQADSRYQFDTRNNNWVKAKHWKSIDVVILGYRLNPFALVVGAHFRTIKNKPIGVIEWGLTHEMKQAFLGVAKEIHTTKDLKGTQWIQPLLCCSVKYLERTETHHLRTAMFQEFLFNKKPENCLWVS